MGNSELELGTGNQGIGNSELALGTKTNSSPVPNPQSPIPSPDIAISVKNLSKKYQLYETPKHRLKEALHPFRKKYHHDFWALKDVSFEIKRGETVGIIGRNGSGKSTLLQIICGTLTQTRGEVNVNGRVAALLELGAGFNPEFTGRDNVYLNGAILGLSHEEMDERFDDIAAFADIGEFIDQPVKTYSSGMYVRLAFAVAINVDPDILVIDEALAVGDVAFQRKCFARLEQISERGGTILFVSHATGSVVELCDRAILLDGGELLLDGKPKRVTNQYLKLMNMPSEKLLEARDTIRALRDLPGEDEEINISNSPKAESNTDALTLENSEDSNEGEESEETRERRLEEEEGWYDPNLKSQSMVEYESKGARIRDLHIIAPSGRQVNVLKGRQRYIFEYTVEYTDTAENIAFGMMLKTCNGVELAGIGTNNVIEQKFLAKDGQSVVVQLSFDCMLAPGSYFLNCGAGASISGERVMLHRILDGLLFRVLENNSHIFSGYVDLNISPSIDLN